MWISRLTLANFRNYSRLDIELPHGLVVVWGGNGQGKSNLVEAISLLATGKSSRADSDREMVSFEALKEDLPYARVKAAVHKGEERLDIDLVIQPAGTLGPDRHQANGSKESSPSFQKRFKVNGLPRRIFDYVGQVQVVHFSPQDIQQISGPPAFRRQYLDGTLCQMDNRYLRYLQKYNHVLAQRNHLLRLIQEKRASAEELGFWNGELVTCGSYLVLARIELVQALNRLAPPFHEAMTEGREALGLVLLQSLGHLKETSLEAIALKFRQSLEEVEGQEIERGVSLIGPHRDDLQLLINGIDAGTYSSRGQHRTITVALRLAQAQLYRERTNEDPLVLLDDVLSELDASRRRYLLSCIQPYQQVFLTTTDLDRTSPWELLRATMFQVREGSLTALESSSA